MTLNFLSSGTFGMQPNYNSNETYTQPAGPTIEQLGWAEENILFSGLTGTWENSLSLPQQQPTQTQPQLSQPPQLQPCENQLFTLQKGKRPYSLEVGPSSPGERQLSPEVEPKDTQNLDELKIRVDSLEETVFRQSEE